MIKVEQIPSSILMDKDAIIQRMKSIEGTSSIILVEPLNGFMKLIMETIEICYSGGDWVPNFKQMIAMHMDVVTQIFPKGHPIFIDMNELFVELEWQLEEEPHDDRAYFTDQIITVAPILATKICYYYLELLEKDVNYLDTRDIIMTDNTYGNGQLIDDNLDANMLIISKNLKDNGIVIIPADIGSSSENYGVSLDSGKVKSQLQSYFQN